MTHLQRAIKALEFYAESRNYWVARYGYCAVPDDAGETARDALAAIAADHDDVVQRIIDMLEGNESTPERLKAVRAVINMELEGLTVAK